MVVYGYYEEANQYTISVKGDIGYASIPELKFESEPNDSFEEANALVINDTDLKCSFNEKDYTDIFYFDVTETSDINITVTNMDNLGMNWLLYHESDLYNYVTYAEFNNNKLTGLYNAEPGRYYLYVYKLTGESGSYTVNVKINK